MNPFRTHPQPTAMPGNLGFREGAGGSLEHSRHRVEGAVSCCVRSMTSGESEPSLNPTLICDMGLPEVPIQKAAVRVKRDVL